MRKILPIFAVLCLVLVPMTASACGGKSTDTASANSGSCNAKADAKTASTDGGSCGTKGATAAPSCNAKADAKTASADGSSCGAAGATAAGSSCGTKGATAAGSSCGATGATAGAASGCCAMKGAMANADFNVSSYFAMKNAAASGCNKSMRNAATQWHKQLTQNLENAESAEHRAAMSQLASMLKAFPYAGRSQQVRFAKITEWCAGYCEQFPARATGTKIVADPETGQRIVELASISG